MKLVRLKLQNFRQHELTELTFDGGLIGIVGSNGAGKTTLLEAIVFALYGVEAGRGKKETLRRKDAPRRASVEVELVYQFAGKTWQVNRGLTTAELRLENEVVANSLRSVTERITASLGMNLQEFFNTYFTRQKDLDAMSADMAPADRSRFLSRVLQYDKLRVAQEQLRKERSQLNAERTALEKRLGDRKALNQEVLEQNRELERRSKEKAEAENQAQLYAARIAQLHPRLEELEKKRKIWGAVKESRAQLDRELAGLTAGLSAKEQELDRARRAAIEVSTLAEKMRLRDSLIQERGLLDQAALAWTTRNQLLSQRAADKKRLDEISRQISTLPGPDEAALVQQRRKDLARQQEETERELQRQRKDWEREKQVVVASQGERRDRWRELNAQIRKVRELGGVEVCPSCGRPLGDEGARNLIDGFTRQLEDVEIAGNFLKQRSRELKQSPSAILELESLLDALRKEVRQATSDEGALQEKMRQRNELLNLQKGLEVSLRAHTTNQQLDSYDPARHDEVRRELDHLDSSYQAYQRASGLAERVAELEAESSEVRTFTAAKQKSLSALDQQLMDLGWSEDDFTALSNDTQEVSRLHQKIISQVAVLDAEIKGIEPRRDMLVQEQERQQKLHEEHHMMLRRSNLFDELDRSFTALLTQLTQEIGPDLSVRASVLLDRLTRGRYTELEMGDDYLPLVIEGGEAKPVLSGGEEDVVNLTMRLAISQLIAERAGQPLSLLILDEVFGSLDEDRRDGVLDMLRALADEFPQVIMITHVEGMREAFDRVIRVVRDERTGISRARDETPGTIYAG